nr:MAG TPA: hypothetical protein [Myoviridae sp. ctNPX13]
MLQLSNGCYIIVNSVFYVASIGKHFMEVKASIWVDDTK